MKSGIGVVATALLLALAGCGGGSSPAGGSSEGATAGSSAADAKRLLRQTFGPNAKASSGVLSGSMELHVAGVPRYRKPITVTVSGPFSGSGAGAPEAALSLGLELRDTAIGGDLILVDDEALIGLGTTGYRIPGSIAATIRRPLAGSDNALASVLAVVGIAPDRWARDARIAGRERIDGVDTIHATAKIDSERFLLDVARLVKVLTKLRITEITGLPRALDRGARLALARSVTTTKGDVYTGAKDHVMRRATIAMTLKPSPADRRRLGGISRLTLAGELNVTDVGTPQTITRPESTGSYAALQLTLDALAESARSKG